MSLKSASRDRLAGLDTLRGLAIVAVMIFHLQWRLPDGFKVIGRFGWMGVDLFFVLSGYLIGSQLLKPLRDGREVSLLGFYRKRAYRILPLYLVVLALYVFWPRWREETGISPVWEYLTFTENFFVDYWDNQAFSHVWSLCVEEHFYLLLPVIVLVLAKKPAMWKMVSVLALFVLLGLGMRSYEYFHVLLPMGRGAERFATDYIERIYYPTYTRLDGLLAGVALALVRMFRPAWWEALLRRANWLLLGGVGLLACVIWIFTDRFGRVGTVVGFPLMAIAMAMLVAVGSDTRCWFGQMRVPGAKLIAMLAYSLYLTHKEIAHLDELYLPRLMAPANWFSALLIGASCLAAAAILHFAVERPFLAFRDRREGRGTEKVDVEARTEPAL
jgi:peptidoglycan/LPS O-acetylase OafA/YrhL